MDYEILAREFLERTHQFRRKHQQKTIDETLRGENFLILYVMNRGGSVLPREISAAMNISSARVAAALNSLESKGLVTRRIDPGDRRRILVDVTPEGRQLACQHQEEALTKVAEMLEKLGESDARELVRIMGRLVEVMSDAAKE